MVLGNLGFWILDEHELIEADDPEILLAGPLCASTQHRGRIKHPSRFGSSLSMSIGAAIEHPRRPISCRRNPADGKGKEGSSERGAAEGRSGWNESNCATAHTAAAAPYRHPNIFKSWPLSSSESTVALASYPQHGRSHDCVQREEAEEKCNGATVLPLTMIYEISIAEISVGSVSERYQLRPDPGLFATIKDFDEKGNYGSRNRKIYSDPSIRSIFDPI